MKRDQDSDSLAGQLLIAMPQMADPRFTRSVIYVCVHNEHGAMGIVINKPVLSLPLPELLAQLGIDPTPGSDIMQIRFGGPVESARGFVLHSADYKEEGTLKINKTIAMTATLDILKNISQGKGPSKHFLALGYAGWGPGQLEAEMESNGWLNVDADSSLLFDEDLDKKWDKAIHKIGIDISMLSPDSGHA